MLSIISESTTTNLAVSDDSILYANIQDVINMKNLIYSNIYVELQLMFSDLLVI